MPDIWMNVDAALSEVPVNVMPLLDDTDFKTRETGIVYNQAGMDLVWNFITAAGAYTQTAVTPTTGGDYDWTNQGDGMYSIEIPASGGASINNDTEGYGWFTGYATGVLPWRGPVIGFRATGLNDLTTSLFNRIADYVLKRNMATCRASSDGDKTGRFILQGFSLMRNKHYDDSGTLRVYEENDTTEDWNAALTTSGSADPITGVDPS